VGHADTKHIYQLPYYYYCKSNPRHQRTINNNTPTKNVVYSWKVQTDRTASIFHLITQYTRAIEVSYFLRINAAQKLQPSSWHQQRTLGSRSAQVLDFKYQRTDHRCHHRLLYCGSIHLRSMQI